MNEQDIEFSVLIGKIIKKILIDKDEQQIWFIISDEEKYGMYHSQSCCEEVTIEDICGDLSNLIDSPVLIAEQKTSHSTGDLDRSVTWTFYEIATIKGSVTIRWHGESNGYYSEEVSFVKI